jgi:hypothetical protein
MDHGVDCRDVGRLLHSYHNLHGPAGAEWATMFGHELEAAISNPLCDSAKKGTFPCFSNVSGNYFCNIGKFVDASPVDILSWHATVADNTEVPCRISISNASVDGSVNDSASKVKARVVALLDEYARQAADPARRQARQHR